MASWCLALGWLIGTLVVAIGAVVSFGVTYFIAAERYRRARLSAAVLVGAAALLANPVFNMALFSPYADWARTRLLADAKKNGCVGKSSAWLIARYGPPDRVVLDRDHRGVELWSYDPGAPLVVNEDDVSFTVAGGVVTGALAERPGRWVTV